MNDMPSSPAAARRGGTSRWEPTLILVGASSGPTSENRNNINSALPRERRLSRKGHSPKLPSQCQPVSSGSGRFGKRIGKVPRPDRLTRMFR